MAQLLYHQLLYDTPHCLPTVDDMSSALDDLMLLTMAAPIKRPWARRYKLDWSSAEISCSTIDDLCLNVCKAEK